jgi:methyltransferase (TIGR00027 family)
MGELDSGQVSPSAILVTSFRALYDDAPAPWAGVHDPVALQLLPAGLARAIVALRWVARSRPSLFRSLSSLGYGIPESIALRTMRIDALVADACAGGIDQVVLLGAGFDARAFRLEGLRGAIVFEVDQPATQALKRRRIGARPPRARAVRYVGADFERDALADGLKRADFAPERPSLWVCEGVSMYLSDEARRALFAAFSSLAAPGSTLLFTYISPENVPEVVRRKVFRQGAAMGEPFRGMVSPADLADELRAHGWRVLEEESASGWARRHWPDVAPKSADFEYLVRATKE